ncbi:TPA: hypothetical protein NI644_001927 [Pseudomonas aeruginosa]|uniref:hypothetical protein n=1 Tax=Pseudomonas aeruginosa TaxID=287 RepID=UPI000211FED5|nr:hypothetical protein [Pseudomonas aeruginosa]EIU4992742.1 hypothetical protein [Pseudomonas aeruginosa]EKV2957407.1 hypothetical protein [Pseudomonas aeruginosa]EKX2412746.1 hypothetical protein [Pseudomonas aeruginosa]EKX2423112.1 hypothetical protein [Pseudomonas aeruginosa]ELY8031193.1 hypothetical protein [Pseudomonas aeruginosa]
MTLQPISDEQLAELADGCMDSIPCPISALYQLAERLRAAEAELSLWRPIMDEVERRAEKEWCLQDKRDFTVTIQYDDYVAIDSAMESTP